MSTTDEVAVEERIAAPAGDVYALVSDVTRLGEWSPETTACRWLGGATGPAVGARFRGTNRSGWRRWSTTCTVREAEPGRRFSFDVDLGPVPIARWTYELADDGDGCRVTERWSDRRAGWMVRTSPLATGVRDRVAHNREGMRATLAALRRAAER